MTGYHYLKNIITSIKAFSELNIQVASYKTIFRFFGILASLLAVMYPWEEMKILNFICIVDPKALHKYCVCIPLCAQGCHTGSGVEELQASGIISSGLYRIGSQGNEALKRKTASSTSY